MNEYVCIECARVFDADIAHKINSVMLVIYECPRCGSRLTKPVKKGNKENDTRTSGVSN